MVSAVLALSALAAATGAGPARTGDKCRAELLPAAAAAPGRRQVASLDLARLRDFGRQSVALGGEDPFTISPDGKSAALVLRRGDPGRNSYCIGVAVVALDGSGSARLVDVGGELILHRSDVRGIPDLPVGNAEPVTPSWSPDGRRLAYLRRDDGLTRVWLARADGSGARAVSRLTTDARAVRWSPDGRSLLVTIRPGLAAGETAIEAEGLHGFLYDKRFWTLSRSRPEPPPADTVEVAIDPDSGEDIRASSASSPGETQRPEGALDFARSSSGALAWTVPRDPEVLLSPSELRVEVAGKTLTCVSPYCSGGIGSLWWGKAGELLFLQGATPENGGITRLLSWRTGRDARPRPILSTADALFGCTGVDGTIFCARETATRPRHIVRIDPESGAIAVVYDPNPEFASLETGKVRRLRWRTASEVESFGDLVLPPGHRPGARHPLVVVQYTSRGFLRGGTGDEYPVFALAARGFAVLNVERPRPYGADVATTSEQLVRMATEGFTERRRVFASLEAGVRQAIALGLVDPKRIGISGLSDGAATVQYALVHSDLFRAAAMSSCCDEPSTSMFAAGPGYADLLIAAGFPLPGTDGSAFWSQYSLAANAGRIETPILLQLTDDEFRLGLETFVTLQKHKVPIEMYVYPGEYHQKWQPAHRLATYERAIDWFDFWLNGRTAENPGRDAEYARWRALARASAVAAAP